MDGGIQRKEQVYPKVIAGFKMTVRDLNLYSLAKNAALTLMRHYHHGAYRVIRDPEGVVSLWAIEGSPAAPFSLSFVERGRVYNNIEDVPPELLKSFLEYVQKSAHKLR